MEIVIIGFAIVLVGGIAVMSLFAFLARKYKQNILRAKMEEIDSVSQYRRKNTPKPKTDKDYLSKDKKQEEEKAQEIEKNVVVKYDPLGQSLNNRRENEVEIVGLAKPVGFWSKFIMSQKLGFILARMTLQRDNKNGYWVNTIKAQAASQGKEQGKGR